MPFRALMLLLSACLTLLATMILARLLKSYLKELFQWANPCLLKAFIWIHCHIETSFNNIVRKFNWPLKPISRLKETIRSVDSYWLDLIAYLSISNHHLNMIPSLYVINFTKILSKFFFVILLADKLLVCMQKEGFNIDFFNTYQNISSPILFEFMFSGPIIFVMVILFDFNSPSVLRYLRQF